MNSFNLLDDKYMVELAAAVVRRAMQDYETALLKGDADAIKSLERFFLSEWGQLISCDNGEFLINQCRQKVAAYPKKLRRPHKI